MIRKLREIKRRLTAETIVSVPVTARHVEQSLIISADDDPARPSERLLDLAVQASSHARSVSMSKVVARMTQPPYYPDVWPGEHYKLLAGLVAVCQPKVVVEIGTSTGMSALAIKQTLPAGARLVTFDITPWDQFSDTCLRAADFTDGSVSQLIGDVSDLSVMRRHEELFQSADIIFADGPKDGLFERVFLERLMELHLSRNPLVVLDDIRLWNMLAIWREIRLPKLDMTSFGHWSGTGFIDWTDRPE